MASITLTLSSVRNKKTNKSEILLRYRNTRKIALVIGKDKYSEIGKKGYLKNGNNDAVKTATSVQ